MGIYFDIVLERRACKAVTDLAMICDELLNSCCFFLKMDFDIGILKIEIMWKGIFSLFLSIQ